MAFPLIPLRLNHLRFNIFGNLSFVKNCKRTVFFKTDERIKDENESKISGESQQATPTIEDCLKEVQKFKDEIEKTQAAYEELKLDYVEALREIDRTRIRGERNAHTAERYGSSKLAKQIVEISDILDKATTLVPGEWMGAKPAIPLDALDKKDIYDRLMSLHEGICMTSSQLANIFLKNDIERIQPNPNDIFDPSVHHAKFEVPYKENGPAPGTVAEVFRPGFRLHDRIIRAAEVGVVTKST